MPSHRRRLARRLVIDLAFAAIAVTLLYAFMFLNGAQLIATWMAQGFTFP